MNSESAFNEATQNQLSMINNGNCLKQSSFRTIQISKFLQINPEPFKNLNGLTLLIDQDSLFIEQSQNISKALSNLTQLSYFKIHNQQKKRESLELGPIFDGIAGLINIQELNLNLDDYYIPQEELKQSFHRLSFLTNIQKLTLIFESNNFIKGAEHISSFLKKLKKITDLYLDLGTYSLTYLMDILILPISKLPCLKKLHFKTHFNKLHHKGLQQMAQQLKKMVNLTDLSIIFVESQFDQSDEESITSSISFLKNLEKLHLELPLAVFQQEDPYKPISERPIKCGLENLSKLIVLDIKFRSSFIEVPHIISLSKGINHLCNLSSLCLSLNRANFTNEVSKSFGSSFALLEDLKELKLELTEGAISDENLQLFKCLVNLQKLTNLQLNFCSTTINPIQMESTFGYISKLSSLISLDLKLSRGSMKSEIGFRQLSQGISKLENLKQFKLELRYLQLNDLDIEIFFSNLQQLSSHLTHLSLKFLDSIVGLSVADVFSHGIGNLTNLIFLELDIFTYGYPPDWGSNFYSGIARLAKLNTLITFEELSKAKKALLSKINKYLVIIN